MKKILLSSLYLSFLNFSNGQSGVLDPMFGIGGLVKTDMGSPFNYKNYGNQVLLQPDGSMYLIIEFGVAGQTLITKKHSDGSSDISYGNNGQTISVPIYSSHAAVQNDGKIVVVGSTYNNLQGYADLSDIAVARFNIDGSLDNTFSGDGIATIDYSVDDFANNVAIDSDGKIVIIGTNFAPSESLIFCSITRLNTDGSLDNSIFSPVTGNQYPHSIVVQNDGKIITGDQQLIRYNSDLTFDNSFNGNGHQAFSGIVNSLAIQTDGKIIAAGGLVDANGNETDFELTRYNIDGSLDITFGVNGTQTTDLGSATESAASVTIQSDGKIILSGHSGTEGDINFAIARYSNNGALDISFSGDGKQITDFGASNDYINFSVIQNDGKLVAIGYTDNGANTNVAVSRYDTDGNPDNSFDGDGTLVDHVNQGSTSYTCTAIQSDGKILAAGYSWNGNNFDFAIARYNTNGSFDNTFSGDGKQMTDFTFSDDKAMSIKIQSDGKILVAGSTGAIVGLIRYNSDGSLDNTFDLDGKQTTDYSPSNSSAPLTIQSDGKILVGGAALARYNSNGSIDLTFAVDGKLTTPMGGIYLFNCTDLALQNDGKIVIVGSGTFQYGNDAILVARYNNTGSVDNTFGNNGVQFINTFDDYTYLVGKSIAIQNDGKIIIGGYHKISNRGGISSSFALMRLTAEGATDNSFNGGAILLSGIQPNSYGTSVIIDKDNKIILAGYSYNGSSDDFTISRYNTDGSLDYSFNNDGFIVTLASSSNDRIAAIAITDNKLYAVGYGQYPGDFGVVARYLLAEAGPLPVTVTEFTATLQEKTVLLQWQTASEQDLAGFTVQRSPDGNNFSQIEYVVAKGNSGSKINYATIDKQPLLGVNYYRLKMIDVDGKFSYSKIVSINVTNGIFTFKISPNPVKDILLVRASGANEKATIQIFDMNGRKLKAVTVILNGNTAVSVNINTLPKGVYNLMLITKLKIETKRFIKE